MRLLMLILVVISLGAGCTHLREIPDAPDLPPDAPEVSVILESLSSPNRALRNLESSGTIRMRLPGEAGTQRFQTGYVRYQAPAKFFAEGRKVGYVVRVYADGEQFLLELPAEKTFFYGREGDRFDDIALDVAPSQIFRELFLIDPLDGFAPNRISMEAYEEAEQRATLVAYRDGLRRSVGRKLVVTNQPEGWCISQNLFIDDDFDNGPVADSETNFEEYKLLNGILLATSVTARYPAYEAEMSFVMRPTTAKVNQQPLEMVEIDVKREELLAKGFQEVRGKQKKAGVK